MAMLNNQIVTVSSDAEKNGKFKTFKGLRPRNLAHLSHSVPWRILLFPVMFPPIYPLYVHYIEYIY